MGVCKDMNLITFNINGIAKTEKFAKCIRETFFQNTNCTVLFLQECKVPQLKKEHEQVLEYFNLGYFFSPAINNAGGLLAVYQKTRPLKLLSQDENHQILQIVNGNTKIVNFYCRAKSFQTCISQTCKNMEKIVPKNQDDVVFLGDFNALLSKKDSSSEKILDNDQRLITYKKLKEHILLPWNLSDIAVELKTAHHTHFDSKSNTASRIDFIFSNKVDEYKESRVLVSNNSDHSPLVASKSIRTIRGQSYWKLNEAVFEKNHRFVKKLLLIYFSKPSDRSSSEWYDKCKSYLRDKLRLLGILLNDYNRCQENRLKEQITEIEANLDSESLTTLSKLKKQQMDLAMKKERLKLKQIKNFYLDVNEGSSKALKKCLSNHSKMNNIERITKENGMETTDTDEILQTFRAHFKERYKNTTTDKNLRNDFISTFASGNQLRDSEKTLLAKPFEVAEIRNAIKKLNPNSAPGPDGLSSNLYKRFSKLFAKIICNLLNETTKDGHFPASFKMAILKLIPKIENPLLPDHYRPISLINTDQKIVSLVLTDRMKNIFNRMIKSNQYAYLPKRSMNSAINYVRLRVENLKQKSQKHRCIVSLDFSKAFDRIDREYIIELLGAVGVPESFCSLIKHAYDGTLSLIEINGFLSKKIKINRGVRQGDPFSALLFIFGVEPLLQKLETLSEVKKISTKKSTAYADDVLCFTDLKSLSSLFRLLESFCKSTQLEVNVDKSTVMTSNSIVGFDSLAPVKQVKNLGIIHYLNETIDVNYTNSIESKIKEIESRKMSWRAKAINLDIFAGSKIYFQLRHQIVSKDMVEKLQKAFTNCIWGSLRHEIRQNVLHLPSILGGIGLPNVQKKICTAKLCDLRNILFSETELLHAKEIELQFKYNAGVLKKEREFFKTSGISIKELAINKLKIEFQNRTFEIDVSTTFKELYLFFIMEDCTELEHRSRCEKTCSRFSLTYDEMRNVMRSLWKRRDLKPYQKNIIYRLLYGGIKDKLQLKLFKSNITVSNCRFCEQSEEDFEHIMFECTFFDFFKGSTFPSSWRDLLLEQQPKSLEKCAIIIASLWSDNKETTLKFLSELKV